VSIQFNCDNPDCGRDVRAPDGTEGKKAKCPHCGKVQVIPAVAADGPSPFSAEGLAPTPAKAAPKHRRGTAAPTHKKTYMRESRNVGRYVKIGLLAAVLAGAVVGFVLVFKSLANKKPGDRPLADPTGIGRYMGGVFGAKRAAESKVSMSNLRLVRDALERYHASNGEYPLELKDLVTHGLNPAALHAPDRDKQAYAYIPYQDETMPGENILVYEETPIHLDKCNVLRLNGQIETLTVEQLQAAVEKTKRVIEGG